MGTDCDMLAFIHWAIFLTTFSVSLPARVRLHIPCKVIVLLAHYNRLRHIHLLKNMKMARCPFSLTQDFATNVWCVRDVSWACSACSYINVSYNNIIAVNTFPENAALNSKIKNFTSPDFLSYVGICCLWTLQLQNYSPIKWPQNTKWRFSRKRL